MCRFGCQAGEGYLNDEVWRDIDDLPSYQVSNHGRVRNKRTLIVKKTYLDNDGYEKVTLTDFNNGKRNRIKTVHRLVATAFLGGNRSDLQVNHKDGVKTNNNATNLEWVTGSENVKHAYNTGLRKPSGGRGPIRPIKIVETGDIYENATECSKAIGTDPSNVIRQLHREIKSVKGYHLQYADRDNSKKSFLYDYQMDAVKRLRNGSILNGGVGSGKSRTSLYYYFTKNGGSKDPNYIPMTNPQDLYIITTAQKRDTLEWHEELSPFLLSTDPELNTLYNNTVVIDSWNNIKKYVDVEGAQFIFDEDRVTGTGAWVKAFYKITRKNDWIILSATAGDVWTDFIPVFVANGFYRNKTEFIREHIVYSSYTKYPKIDRYLNEGRLIRLRDRILIDMDFERKTKAHHEDVYVKYDISKYKDVMKYRWDPYNDEPIQQASGLCYILRKIVNTDDSRQVALLELFEKHPKMIVFYSFDYERDILLNLAYGDGVEIAEYSGHAHQPVPDSDRWVYLVNYTAGNAGWNCIKTDTIVFFSQNYSYKVVVQAAGRIDRLNTPYTDLYYYHLKSRSGIDLAISKALRDKKQFNERKFTKW